MTITTKSLHQLISEYPDMLRKALEEKAKCERELEKLEDENESSPEMGGEDEEIGSYKQQKELAKLETKIEKLTIRLQEAEGIAEMEHRNSTSKPTESSARATIRSDPRVIKYKMELADLEEEKTMLKIEIRQTAEEKRFADTRGRLEQNQSSAIETNPNIEKARISLEKAEIHLQAVEAIFEGYKLLAILENKG